MLDSEQIKNIKRAEKIIFTTSDKFNQPRSIYVIPSKIESDKIVLSNIQMHKSFSNIQQNSKCFLNVLIPELDDLQYKIEGEAQIFKSGKLFEEIKRFEESNNLPPELEVHAIIVINIKLIEQSNG